MSDIFIIARFTMRDMLGRKSFRISTLIIVLLIILGCNVPNFLSSVGVDSFADKTLIVDSDNIFENTLEQLSDACPSCGEIEITQDKSANVEERVAGGDVDSALVINRTDNHLNFNYVVKNAATNSQVPTALLDTLEKIYLDLQISKLKITPKELASVTPDLTITISQTDDEEISGNIFAMMMLSLILFYAIYFCAFQVSNSITTEKTSKIIETLVTSTSPTSIILGKTIGIGLVGLLQMLIFVATALISAHLFLDPALISNFIDLSHLTIGLGLITALYFILGYFTYAFLYALTGSTVSKPDDIQSANTPIALLSLFSFYLAYFTLTDPTSGLNFFAALFPFSSPFCMPIRLMMGLASPLEVLGSIAILALTIFLIARIAIKIYSDAILRYGTKLTWREIWQNYKAK